MANIDNSIGTNGAFGGRTTPNAFNDVLGAFSGRGILSGWGVEADTGMSVTLGGDGETRDVAIAEDNAGNKVSVNNIPGIPLSLDIPSAPSTNSRIDAIVVYIDNPPQGSSTAVDNYGAVNALVVSGNTASTPVAPTDSAIRTAITTDGGSGATAYYVILGYVTVASGTTDISANMITAGDPATLNNSQIADGAITTDKLDNGAVTSDNVDWTTLDSDNTDTILSKLRTYTFTATTDPNGFAAVPASVVNPTTGIILAVLVTNQLIGSFGFVFNNGYARDNYTIRCLGWDLGSQGSMSATITIRYCLF